MLELRSASILCFLTLATSCDRIKRETTDRLDSHEPSTWTSQSDCESLLSVPTDRQHPRLGTWNVRYFPDSQEETQTETEPSDA